MSQIFRVDYNGNTCYYIDVAVVIVPIVQKIREGALQQNISFLKGKYFTTSGKNVVGFLLCIWQRNMPFFSSLVSQVFLIPINTYNTNDTLWKNLFHFEESLVKTSSTIYKEMLSKALCMCVYIYIYTLFVCLFRDLQKEAHTLAEISDFKA